jgi:hypothetical protein
VIQKNGTIGELTAPFYEFDAYIATSPDSQGMPLNVLYLAHRYRNIMINFGAAVPRSRLPTALRPVGFHPELHERQPPVAGPAAIRGIPPPRPHHR